jgi:hypothetical protein
MTGITKPFDIKKIVVFQIQVIPLKMYGPVATPLVPVCVVT